MLPAFSFNIGQSVHKNLVTCGKFDGRTPSIAFGVTGGKVLVHSPHETGGKYGQENALPAVRYLNFNKKITALQAGCLSTDPGKHGDILYVGTESNLLAYDVERNSDVFYRDATDGVNTLVIGRMSHIPKPLIFAGGNCSIFGFDKEGTESFWTVTCDNVTALALADVDNDGLTELVVGSDDFEMRVFKNEESINETTETDRITHLCPLYKDPLKSKFGYGLGNSTIGIYESMNRRAWRVKGKGKVTAMGAFDLDADGVPELVSGWSNGSFNVRKDHNGQVIYKSSMGPNTKVAALMNMDYRMTGVEELIVCSDTGDVKGFLPISQDAADATELYPMNGKNNGELTQVSTNSTEQQLLSELQTQKQELRNELKMIEKGLNAINSKNTSSLAGGTLPPGTDVSYSICPSVETESVLIKVTTNSTQVVVVNLVVIDKEGLLMAGKEVCSVSPNNPTNTATLKLKPSRNMSCTFRTQTHLAVRGYTSTHLHVFEADISIPKFSSFCLLDSRSHDASNMNCLSCYHNMMPDSTTTMKVPITPQRVQEWLQNSFLPLQSPNANLPIPATITTSGERVHYDFIAYNIPMPADADASNKEEDFMRESIPTTVSHIVSIDISASRNASATNRNNNINHAETIIYSNILIKCDSMDLVGEIIQDMGKYLNITELESLAHFPREFSMFEETIQRITEYNSQRMALTADMADDSQRIKALIVRAEDCRLMNDMSVMRKSYTELFSLNKQLLNGYNIRRNAHEGLVNALKEVNNMIQKAANLRLGKRKTNLISECRMNVKKNQMYNLIKIISNGTENPVV